MTSRFSASHVMLCRSLLVASPASVSFSLLAVSAMAFREMCSVGDAKALLETLAEYAQPALQGALLQLPEMQRVRLLELIADSLEPGAAEAFAPVSVDEEVPPDEAKLDASDEPKLEGCGDDAMQGTADAKPASVPAQDDGGDDYWWHGANRGWYGSSRIGPKTIHSQPLLQWTRQVVPSGPEPKTEAAAASDDMASTGRPGILKPEGGRPSPSDASASAAHDSFGRLPKRCPLLQMMTLPADASGASEIPLLVETMVIQCQERCGDCQRAHCGKQFTSWDAARKHRQQMHRCRYCWQLFQKRMRAGGYA